MRTPKRRRPQARAIATSVVADLQALSERVRYIGSPEHKDTPSFAGSPRPRSDASICDRRFVGMQDALTRWLGEGIRRGCISSHFEGDFPRYVWYMDQQVVYEARLVNRETGEYKGYALNKSEWPVGIGTFYA